MTNNRRVFHTRGFSLKFKQACKAVENGAAVWITYGETIRPATFAESIAARQRQADQRDPLPNAEIPGLLYQPAAHEQAQNAQSKRLAWEANKLFQQVTA